MGVSDNHSSPGMFVLMNLKKIRSENVKRIVIK